MASLTKDALADALKSMLAVKPIDKITVKDLVELCGVNRQTFYYHFDDVYDLLEWSFEEDANENMPGEIVYDRWREDVAAFFIYLYNNRTSVINIYNSNCRTYMLRFFKARLQKCIQGFAEIVSQGKSISWNDLDFVIEFYSNGVVGFISQWIDLGMPKPAQLDIERYMIILDNSVENLIERFEKE